MLRKASLSLSVMVLLGSFQYANAEKLTGFKDYNVIASFIYNLTQNVEFSGNPGRAKLCTISSNPADKVPELLTKIFSVKKEANVDVVSGITYNGKSSVAGCNYIYIGNSEQSKLKTIIDDTRDMSALTVSSIRDFAKHGGVVGFVIEDGQDAVLQINTSTMKKSNITINARLLQIAQLFQS